MKAITVRDIPEPLAKRIQERAKRTGTSLNRTVIEMLDERTSDKSRGPYRDLDHLAGTWSPEEWKDFQGTLSEQRRIEPEQW